MEDIGEIIYFVLIIAFALLGSLGKKKKKKATVGESPGPPAFPDPWSELEKQLTSSQKAPEPKPAVNTQRNQPEGRSFRTEIPKYSSETIYSSENDQSVYEVMSYDTVDDVSKLRVKKQMKETISKKQSAFKSIDLSKTPDTSYSPIDIEFDDIQDVKRAFIYSEIFNRKYS